MHQLNVLVLGSSSFVSTLIELKPFLKFNLHLDTSCLDDKNVKIDIIIFYKELLENKKNKDVFVSTNLTKILASNRMDESQKYDTFLKLPTTVNEINAKVESLAAKKIFNKNSSIKIKEYLLDKNEKKLFKNNDFVILTEKEIQLLETFLSHKKPISKIEILSAVWHYSSDADTHTVETHIYRLRKKISEKFLDTNFILNNKDGYYV